MKQFMEVHDYIITSTGAICTYTFYLLDNVPEDETYDRIALGLFVCYTILSIIGIIFACICLWFNLWFRNQKYVSQIY